MIDLRRVQADHAEWLYVGTGKRANLRGANLRGANLSWADLSRAYLRGACTSCSASAGPLRLACPWGTTRRGTGESGSTWASGAGRG